MQKSAAPRGPCPQQSLRQNATGLLRNYAKRISFGIVGWTVVGGRTAIGHRRAVLR
ncbi:hypothetical protein MPL3356_320032 [Mesorhizobium plurifarium]|uniref:Uncharacterized protein n=1 Tax=Mesorhizobium plurifarium TaxID=69974 RepID=A0A090E0H1_MESPL|nr:hypothetical protein MPL3356_320032 [Mesorhizobium plurifarium]